MNFVHMILNYWLQGRLKIHSKPGMVIGSHGILSPGTQISASVPGFWALGLKSHGQKSLGLAVPSHVHPCSKPLWVSINRNLAFHCNVQENAVRQSLSYRKILVRLLNYRKQKIFTQVKKKHYFNAFYFNKG